MKTLLGIPSVVLGALPAVDEKSLKMQFAAFADSRYRQYNGFSADAPLVIPPVTAFDPASVCGSDGYVDMSIENASKQLRICSKAFSTATTQGHVFHGFLSCSTDTCDFVSTSRGEVLQGKWK